MLRLRSIPLSLDNKITALIRTEELAQEQIAANNIAPVVSSLERDGNSLCGRLSTRAFILLFALLRLAEPDTPILRGLCLLTVSKCRSYLKRNNTNDKLYRNLSKRMMASIRWRTLAKVTHCCHHNVRRRK
jgi:hypothetical protein